MIITLLAKNKFGFVDRSVEKPNNRSEMVHYWNRVDSMVISWLLNSLSKQTVKYMRVFFSYKQNRKFGRNQII